MRKLTRMLAFWGIMSMAIAVQAQESHITLGSAGSDRLQADLKYLVDLSPPALKKQWETLKGVLDSFVQGADTKGPVKLDISFGAKEVGYTADIPFTKLSGRGSFFENVESFGFKITGPDAGGLYTATQVRAQARGAKVKKAAAGPPPKPFYLRPVGQRVLMSSSKELLPASAKADGVPKEMLPGDTDLAAEMKNDAASLEARKKNFDELRKQLEAGLAFNRTETPAEFELRKLSLAQNLNEAERFLIQSELLSVHWTTDAPGKKGVGDLVLTGLEGTDLDASIALLVKKPSQFANVKFGAKPVLQLRVNFAVDPMRSAHAQELYAKLLPVMQTAMDSRPNLNAEGKATGKATLAGLFEMLNDSLPLQVLDTIIDVHDVGGGKHVAITAIRTADGTKAVPLLQNFPKIRAGWKFEEKTEEHHGVTLHKLTMAPHRVDEFKALFGGEPVIHVGTSKSAVWAAAGEGSLEKLKAAIDQAAQPAPEKVVPEFLTVEMRFEPWVRVLEIMRAKEPASTSTDKTVIENQKQLARMRKYALAAFSGGDDILKGKMWREGREVKGTMSIEEGIFKFLGTAIADFTAENLN